MLFYRSLSAKIPCVTKAITIGVPHDDNSTVTDTVTVQVQEDDNTTVTNSFKVPVL
jgi:hypothetical protein